MLYDELHMCGTHGEKKELPSLLLAAAALYTRLNKWNIEGFFGVFLLQFVPNSNTLSMYSSAITQKMQLVLGEYIQTSRQMLLIRILNLTLLHSMTICHLMLSHVLDQFFFLLLLSFQLIVVVVRFVVVASPTITDTGVVSNNQSF